MRARRVLAYVGLTVALLGTDPLAASVITVATPAGVSNQAGGIVVDAEGRVYSADFGGTQLLRLNLDGSIEVFASGFKTPSGNAFDAQGRLYQSNYSDPLVPGPNDSISRITRKGRVSTFASGLNGPVGIAIDAEGTLFVAMCDSNNITRISAEGEASVFASGPLFNCPNGIIFDDRGLLFVVNFNDGAVLKITPDGQVENFATSPGGGSGHIAYVSGGLYMTDRLGNQIHRFDVTSGRRTTLAGSGAPGATDGDDLTSTFNQPNGIARTPAGDALYTNELGGLVRRIQLTLERPRKPKALRASDVDATSVSLSWKHPSRNKEGFRIEAKTQGGEFETIGSVPSNQSNALVAGLEPGTAYTLRVLAFNGTAVSKGSKKRKIVTDP